MFLLCQPLCYAVDHKQIWIQKQLSCGFVWGFNHALSPSSKSIAQGFSSGNNNCHAGMLTSDLGIKSSQRWIEFHVPLDHDEQLLSKETSRRCEWGFGELLLPLANLVSDRLRAGFELVLRREASFPPQPLPHLHLPHHRRLPLRLFHLLRSKILRQTTAETLAGGAAERKIRGRFDGIRRRRRRVNRRRD